MKQKKSVVFFFLSSLVCYLEDFSKANAHKHCSKVFEQAQNLLVIA